MSESPFLWLLSTVRQSVVDGRVVLWNGDDCLTIEASPESALLAITLLDGTRRASDLDGNLVLEAIVPHLEHEGWLVRLDRPLALSPDSPLSRQLAYFAHLERERPDRALAELRRSTVAVLGVGGIGGHAALALAGAGVGRLLLFDPDVVAASNLNRQVLYRRDDVGSRKVDVARRFLVERHEVEVRSHALNPFLSPRAAALLAGADLLLFSGDFEATVGRDGTVRELPRLPMLTAGYVGATGVVGPIYRPDTACWACTARMSEVSTLCLNECPRPDGWNCSGSTVNGLLGALAGEIATRFLAPSLGAPPLMDEILEVDMKTLAVRRTRAAAVPCEHRTTRGSHAVPVL